MGAFCHTLPNVWLLGVLLCLVSIGGWVVRVDVVELTSVAVLAWFRRMGSWPWSSSSFHPLQLSQFQWHRPDELSSVLDVAFSEKISRSISSVPSCDAPRGRLLRILPAMESCLSEPRACTQTLSISMMTSTTMGDCTHAIQLSTHSSTDFPLFGRSCLFCIQKISQYSLSVGPRGRGG